MADRLAEARLIAPLRTRRYRGALRRYRPSLPVLDFDRTAIVCALKTRGVAQTDLGALALPDSRAMFEAARALIEKWAEGLRQQASDGVDFLIVPPAELAAHPQIYRFGLNPRLLELIESYIGLPIGYDGVTLQYTVADGRAASTRLWHRDREDRHMIKLVVYLTDVDPTGGPFQLLPSSGSSERRRGRRPGFYLDRHEAADLDRSDSSVQPITCEGAAGTTLFADTAHYFHRGKPATRQDRAALFFSYFARVPQRPYFCSRSGLSRRQIASLVEDLTPTQQAVALWQETLPWRWRFIPTSAT